MMCRFGNASPKTFAALRKKSSPGNWRLGDTCKPIVNWGRSVRSMKLERIITLANRKFRVRFAAMERSLRAVGCALPISVIPYDNERFDLPKNSEWWECPE